MKYKAVIFDLWGTLIESFPVQQHRQSLSKMSAVLEVPFDEFSRLWIQTSEERVDGSFPTIESYINHVCRSSRGRPENSDIEEATRIRLEFIRQALTPRTHAIETLTFLKNAGCKIGLVSICSAEIPLLWQETPFALLIDVPIFSCSVGLTKPDPRIYQLAWEKLQVAPQDCLYIGDGGNNELTGAAAVGMHPVLICPSLENVPDSFATEVEKWQPSSISTLKDVVSLVEK